MLAIIPRRKIALAQRIARARLIHEKRRDIALRQPTRQANQKFHLLRAIQSIKLNKRGLRAFHTFSRVKDPGQIAFTIRDFDKLGVRSIDL